MSKYNIEKEVWKDVEGYEGYYQVSNLGRIKSLERVVPHKRFGTQKVSEKILSEQINKGYAHVTFTKNGKQKKPPVARLVAKTFVPNPEGKPEVNHIDENKLNNHVDNLEWVTAKENSNHGTRKKRIGEFVRANPHLFEKGQENLKKIHKQNQVPIVMIDKNTNKSIKRFNSLKEAYDYLGIDSQSTGISDVLSGRSKTSRGFKWEYAKK